MNSIRGDVTQIKAINKDIIRSTLKKQSTVTKAMIAKYTGLSIATCSKVLNELCDSGEAVEVAVSASRHGRPSIYYSYNKMYLFAAGIYIMMDHHRIQIVTAVSNSCGEIIRETMEELQIVDYELIRDRIADLLREHEKIKVVAVGLPAVVRNDTIELCAFGNLHRRNLSAMLEKDFPGLIFRVENEMNAAAYGFYRKNCTDRETTVGVFFQPDEICTGLGEDKLWTVKSESVISNAMLGSGFVINGKLQRGYTGFAGEVWSLPVYFQSDLALSKQAPDRVLAEVIACVIPVVNPEIIVITGGMTDENLVQVVRARCMERIPEVHMPRIIICDSIHREYINGLLLLALEAVADCDVALIRKT